MPPQSHHHISPSPSHHLQQQHPDSSYTNPTATTDSQQVRIRKPRACDLCRRKKIRCDYDPMLPDNQCSSCRGYRKTCDFAEVAKKRGPPKGYVEGLETRLHRMEQLLMNMASSSNISTETIRQYINNNTDQTTPTKDDSSDVTMRPDSRSSSSKPSPPSVTMTSPTSAEPPSEGMKRPCQTDVSRQLHEAQIEQQLENVKEGKYSYLGSSSGVYMLNRLFPANYKDRSEDDGGPTPEAVMHGNEDDLMVARFGSKSARLNVGPGANWSERTSSPSFSSSSSPSSSSAKCVSASKWRLPPKPVIDRLVKLYFTEMNSYLPIVDEDEFMDKYRNGTMGDENGGVSKALLMTICRTTMRILPADDPVAKAYNIDRTAMFRDMVQQLETNYELDFMEPQIEAIQNLLLNSANADGWGPKSANWLATSIAVKMAQDLGLHRSNTQWTLPAKRIEARKRLWWSAYVVDRWVCASLGRPLTVNDADCDLEYPEVGDNGKYTAFVSIIKLSGVLGDVLRAVCSPRARTLGDQGLGPDRISSQLQQALVDWKLELPSKLWLSDTEMEHIHRRDISAELETKINTGAGQLRILYIAVQLLSKRPSIILGSGQTSSQSPKTIVAPQECLDAVNNVLDLFRSINFSSLMNENREVADQAKRQTQAFRTHYIQLEHHFIETKLITFLDCITRMIQRDEDTSNCPSPSSQKRNHDSAFPSGSLWGASSGMDWHDIMDLIGE